MGEKGKVVGVYDSGIGGMTLLAECRRLLPQQNFYYLGDNANAPYGGKTKAELLTLARRAFDYFLYLHVSAVVVACNTVTTECIEELRAEYPFPVIGAEPALRSAIDCKKLLVLATEATLRSEEFRRLKAERKGETVCFAPQKLVPEIERNAPFLEKIGIADHLPKISCDGVVLGCTHYVYLKKTISEFYNAPCFDGNEGTAKQLKKVLFSSKINYVEGAKNGNLTFLGNFKVVNAYMHKQMFSF